MWCGAGDGDVDAPPALTDAPPPPPPPEEKKVEEVDDDAPPPISAAAARANASVASAVASASADSASLAATSAPNTYLPVSPGFSLPLPPEPVRFPRAPINIKLAVLLLRSGYETVDDMDVMPMDQFQIKFWKSRQAEWEPYKNQYYPLTIEQARPMIPSLIPS